MAIFRFSRIAACFTLAASLIFGSSSSDARFNGNFFETLTRSTAKVADDIPIKHSDELLQRVGQSKAVRNMVDSDLAKSGKRIDNMSETARRAARSAEVLTQLERGLSANPQLLRQLDGLDEAGRETALVLVKGGQRLTTAVPDIAARSRLLRSGGADLAANAGLYGDDFVKDALRVQNALDAGALTVPASKRAVTLSDFSRTIGKMGQGGLDFFNKTIKPNWKVWTTSGLLAWWVLDPEGFQDTAGTITHEGAKRIAELAGEVVSSTVSGTIEGSGQAVANIGSRTWSAFLEQGTAGIIGILLALALASLGFRRVRYYAMAPVRWLNRSPDRDD
jgi:hypothetical protein